MRRNVSGQFVGAQLNSKTDGSEVTTGTTTVYVTGDAGTQAAGSVGSGACTHEGHGYWTYAPAQAETNYTQAAFTFVNTNAITATVQLYPISYGASGQMTAVELGADQAVNTTKFGGTTVTARDIGASVLLSSGTGAGQLDFASGTINAVNTVGTVVTLTGLGTQAKADVNAEVVDALNVDSYGEPGQEAPPASTNLVKKIGYLYKAFRNKITQDATTLKIYADDGTTVDQKATASDDATTFTRGEIGSGP